MPLIAIAGCDGAGKSTLVRALAAELSAEGLGVEIVDKWDVFDPARYPECAFLDRDRERFKLCVSSMEGVARALFVFWMISLTLKRVDSACDTIYLVDGYWMKHAASEILRGCPPAVVFAAVDAMPRADVTFLLEVSAGAASERRPRRSPYECGLGADASHAAFASHQSKIGLLLTEWAEDRGWVRIDSNRAPESVLEEVLSRIPSGFRRAPAAARC